VNPGVGFLRTYSEIVWLRTDWTASTRANANRTTGLPNSYLPAARLFCGLSGFLASGAGVLVAVTAVAGCGPVWAA
jgi:hypothetical protein